MKPNSLVVSTIAALLGGCASGGGSGGADDFVCALIVGACGIGKALSGNPAPRSAASAPPAAPAAPLVSWSASPAGEYLPGAGVAGVVTYETSGATLQSMSAPLEIAQNYSVVRFDAERNIESLLANGYAPAPVNRTTPFAGLPRSFPNPLTLGWEYQSFGVWNHSNEFGKMLVATSFGAATPGSAVPLVGAASFTGKLSGLYASPGGQAASASADLTVSADFSARSLGFASRGTTLTPAGSAPAAAPHLDLSGRLSYAPGSSSFNGTLTNAAGTMSGGSTGRFYGPAAQELGGVFTLRAPASVETFVGAYGAKR